MSEAAPDTRPLRAEIEAQGRARLAAIRRDTRARIGALRAERRAEAERRRAEALRGPERALRLELARDLAQARIAGERERLEAQHALLDRVFERARALLPRALETPAARSRLVERAREALGFVPAGGAVIACSTGVADVLEGPLERPGDVRIETHPDLPAGFRVEAASGALVIDATLERLLELGRPTLAIEVLRRLRSPAS